MGSSVVVFSPDTIRGNIVARKLRHEGLDVQLFDRAVSALGAVVNGKTRALVFDTVGCLPDELRSLARFCESSLPEGARIIGLGDPAEGLPCLNDREMCQVLPGPVDPERIVAEVRNAFSAKKQPPAADAAEHMEDDLLDFLRLR